MKITVEQFKELAKKKSGSKYRNKPTKLDGIRFDSGKEATRYAELKILELDKKISDLKLQVRYALDVNGVHICDYVADFVYFDVFKSATVVEDVKSTATKEIATYKIKKKLMKALYGIAIQEI